MPVFKHDSPYRTLTVAFVAWKLLLLAIAAGSQVGPMYDTSSSLLILSFQHDNESGVRSLVTRLASWDAIYFVKAAQRGYLFEQEWAFGSALPTCISLIIRALTALGLVDAQGGDAHLAALVGVVFTHSCHYLSSLILYQLGLAVWADSTWALVSALLHVLSPAGLFLSAPYAESPCALLSFVGWLLLVRSCSSTVSAVSRSSRRRADVLTLAAGVSFGLATVFRSNGLLNGAPFAFEVLRTLYHLVEDSEPNSSATTHFRRLIVLGFSGLFVAAGSLVPQVLAYKTYCAGTEGTVTRPWCLNLVPSIYGFVQREYWNSGFLRYWTIPNAPLFLLAAPMLFIMGKGGKDMFFQAAKIAQAQPPAASHVDGARLRLVVRSMVFAQVVLVVLTFTSHHVQIITRLSSGYPAYYWWVAACLRSPKTRQMGSGLVVYMVMYALIQAVLFASFLPPA